MIHECLHLLLNLRGLLLLKGDLKHFLEFLTNNICDFHLKEIRLELFDRLKLELFLEIELMKLK